MQRIIKRTAIVLGGIFLLLVISSLVISTLFEDDIKAKVSQAINANLRSSFTSSDMSLDLFWQFPNASIHVTDVLIKEAIPEKVFPDTLLYAEDLFMEFGWMNVFSGDVTIRSITANAVIARPGVDEYGELNYIFWKSDTSASETTIDLQRIELNDLHLHYADIPADIRIGARSKEISLAGLFNSEGNQFDVRGSLFIDSLLIDDSGYAEKMDTELDLTFLLPSDPNILLSIEQGRVTANDVNLLTDLSWRERGDDDELVLRLQGSNLDLEGAASLIPELGSFLIEHYGIKGSADMDILYAGTISERSKPELDVRLNVRNGKLTERTTGVTFQDISLNGDFAIDSKGRMNKLNIQQVNASAGKGKLSGNLSVEGTSKAGVKGKVKSNIDLGDLLHFAQYEGEIEGQLKLNTEFKGTINLSDGFSKEDMRSVNVIGTAELGHATFQLAGMRHGFEDMNALLVLNGNDASIDEMKATLIDDEIRMQGSLKGLVNYLLFDDHTLEVIARVQAQNLDLEKAVLSTDGDGDESRELVFPKNVNVNLTMEVSELEYASFQATDISGTVRLQNGKLIAKPIGFQTSEGSINATILLNTSSSSDYPFEVNAQLSNINVKTLFDQFDQFGQSFITSEHLNGTINATMSMETLLARDMRIDTKSLRSNMDITIRDGELIEHSPMIEIADHVRNNALYSAFIRADELESRLRHIEFEELNNTIRIVDGKVIIPTMEVRSTAMNVNVSGVHGFDDQVDHHINFRLADLLTKKNKDAEFGEVIDDGTGMRIFLRMYGHTSDLHIENDRKGLAEFRKHRRQERNQELKEIITSPFSGKKDPPKKDDAKTGPIFNVEFGDEETDPPKKKKKGLMKLLTQDEEKKKDAVSFTIDDEDPD